MYEFVVVSIQYLYVVQSNTYILNMKRISVSFVRTARWLANSRDGEEERTLGVAMAMQVLRECPALRIEDLVNIFPDFTTIDHLKARASATASASCTCTLSQRRRRSAMDTITHYVLVLV